MNLNKLQIDPSKIQILMINEGWTAADVSRKCGISKETVYRLLRNKRATVKTLHKLCNGLKIPVQEVLMNVR